MARADVELLFGVKGGGSISSGSGQLIRNQLAGIMAAINKDALKVKVEIDPASAKAMQAQLNSMYLQVSAKVTNGTPKQSAQDAQQIADAVKRANFETVQLLSQTKKLNSMQSSLAKTYGSFNKIKSGLDAATVAQINSEYKKLYSTLQKMSASGKIFKNTGIENVVSSARNLQNKILDIVAAEKKSAAASKEKYATAKQILAVEKQLSSFISKNTKTAAADDIAKAKALLDKLRQSAKLTAADLRNIQNEFAVIGSEAAAAGRLGRSFGDSISRAIQKFGGWGLITHGITTVTHGIRSMITDVRELDAAMTELRKVTNETDATYSKFLVEASDRAHNLGASLTDTVSATADFARLGYDIEEATDLSDAALVYKNVGDGIDDINTASESIISTMQGFGIAASDAMLVVDKFNEVGNNFAISSVGIGDALVRSAAALSSANNTLDESIALVTATNKVVQDPEKVGTTLKTVSMFLRAAKTEAEEAGIETDGMADSVSKLRGELLALTGGQVDIQIDENTYKSTYQIMKEIAGVWNQISDVSQANILEMLGGKRNANVVAALIQNFSEAEQVLETAANASGSALAENEKYLDSINGKIQQLNAQFEDLSHTVFDSNAIKMVVDGTKGVVEAADAFGEKFGALSLIIPTITGAIAQLRVVRGEQTGIFDIFGTGGEKNISIFNRSIKGISESFAEAKTSGVNFINAIKSGKLSDIKTSMAQFGSSVKTGFGLTFSGAVDDINAYNNMLNSSKKAQKSFLDTIKSSNQTMHGYLSNLNGAKASLSGYIAHCKKASTQTNSFASSLLKSQGAMRALSLAGSFAMQVVGSIAFSAAISAIMSLVNKQKELREATLEASTEYKESSGSLQAYIAEVSDLNSALDSNTLSEEEAYEARSRLLEIQDALKTSYGAEASSLNLITMSADEASAAMNKLAKAQAEAFLYENSKGISQAKKNMGESTRAIGMTAQDVNAHTFSKLDKIANSLGMDLQSKGAQLSLSITADVSDANQAFQKFKAEAEAQGINLGEIRSGSGTLESAINNQLSTLSDLQSQYGETYDQYISASITASDEYSSALQRLTDAQSAYEDAVTRSYTSESDRADAVARSIAQIEDAKIAFSSIQFAEADSAIKEYFESFIEDLNTMYSGEKLKLDLGFANKDAIKEYTGIVKEYKQVVAEAKEATGANFMDQTKFGNIDTDIRKRLEWTAENVELYRKALESWGDSADDYLGTYSTVDGILDTFDGHEIAFTAMLNTEDGVEYLDENTVSKYINKVVKEATKNGGDLEAEILRLDAEGFEINGKKISNMIAAIGDDARKVSELMHFTGKDGAIADSFNRLVGEYGDKNAITGMIDAIGKLDQDNDGVTKISEILELMAEIDSGAADVFEEDANALELLQSMAESAGVSFETFLNTLSEVGFTKGYIGDALSALTSGLDSAASGFAAASSAAAGYQEALKSIENEGGEKNSNFTVYAEAYDKFQEQVKAKTLQSNAFWASAELLLGEDKLRELEYNSQAVVQAVNSVSQVWKNEGDYGVGFLNYIHGLEQQGLLLDENKEKLIDIQKANGQWKLDFEPENLEKLLPILNMTEEGFYACIEAVSMWSGMNTADVDQVAERVDQLGLAVETTSGKFIAADSIEESLSTVFGKQDAYKSVQALEDYGYTLISVKDILADGEEGARNFLDVLSEMDLVSAFNSPDEGEGLIVNLDDMTKRLTEMGMTTPEIESLVNVLAQIPGLNFSNAAGKLLELEEATGYVTRGDIAESFTELASTAMAQADALRQLEGNENLEIKIDVQDLETTEEQMSALDGTIEEMNAIKAKPDIDASEIEHANNVIAYCIAQKQLLARPDVMNVDTSKVEGDLGNTIKLLQDVVSLQNTIEIQQGLGIDTTNTQAELDLKIAEIQALDPTVKAQLGIDSTQAESIQTQIDEMTAGVMISAGVQVEAIEGYNEEAQTCDVIYNPNTDALPKSFDPLSCDVEYVPLTDKLPTYFKQITRYVNYVATGDIQVNGTAHISGTAKASGTANAFGDWGTAPGGQTLVGELGQEIVVDPKQGKWYTVGDSGAEFVNIPPGAIVFNHKQTESLLENGFVAGRGMALASGTAAAIGFDWATPPGVDYTTSKKKSSYKADLEIDADTSKLEESMKEALDAIKEEIDDIISDFDHRVFLAEKNGADVSEIVAIYKKMQESVHEYADRYRAKGLDENSKYIQELQKQWWDYHDAIQEAIVADFEKLNKEQENSIKLIQNWIDNDIGNMDTSTIRGYTEQVVEHYEKMQQIVHEQAEYLRSQGYSDISDEVSELSDLWWDYEKEIQNAKDSILDSMSDLVDGIQDAYNTLHDAADEYAESGFITVDTLQEIINMGVQYLSFLQDENGQLVINEERIRAVMAARVEELAVETALNYVDQIRQANMEGDIETLNRLLYATQITTGATWELVYANLALAGLSSDQYQAALNNINALRALSQSAITSIGQTTGKAKEQLEEMKDGLDTILDLVIEMLEHQLEEQIDALEDLKDSFADIIDLQKESIELAKEESDYRDEVSDKLKEMQKIQERINKLDLDDSREAQAEKIALQEDLAEIQKELADIQADYAYDAQTDSLDKMQDAYEEQKNNEIEILEQSLSSYQKKYDAAIAYIESNWSSLLSKLTAYNSEYGSILNSELTDAWNNALAAAQKYGSFVNALGSIQTDIDSMNDGGSLTLGQTATGGMSYDESVEYAIHDIIKRMYANSVAWKQASTQEEKDALANDSYRLGTVDLAKYGVLAERRSDGNWYIKGTDELLFDRYKDYIYHTGGVAGDNPTLEQNEILAILEKGELILDKKKEDSLFKLVDFATVMSSRLGVALSNVDFSQMFSGMSAMTSAQKYIAPVPEMAGAHTNIVFGDTYIYGSNDETVKKHQDISRRFVNDVIEKLNLRK